MCQSFYGVDFKRRSLVYEGVKYNPGMVMGRDRKGIKLNYVTDTRPIDPIIDFIKIAICSYVKELMDRMKTYIKP